MSVYMFYKMIHFQIWVTLANLWNDEDNSVKGTGKYGVGSVISGDNKAAGEESTNKRSFFS